MNTTLCKILTPWLAIDCFDRDEAFWTWLRRRTALFTNLRIVMLILSLVPLLVGYVMDNHPIMLLTILPLLAILLLSLALERMETALHGQNKNSRKGVDAK